MFVHFSWFRQKRGQRGRDRKNTERSLADLSTKLVEVKRQNRSVGGCFSVRINSGLFGVSWELTKPVVSASDADITVVALSSCTPVPHRQCPVYVGFAD